jgi:tetratricopeptide (TPR) repeat protein
MRLWIYASLLAIAVGIASWTAVHRHRQTLWLRAYREANDSLQRGHYADAEGQLLILTGSKQPGEHQSALSMNLLAVVYQAEGKRSEAEPLFEKAIHIFDRERPSSNLDFGKACTNEGRMYLEEGKLQEAEQRLEQAIAVYRVNPDLAGAELGGALHNLGLVRVVQRRTAEGQVLLEQALQIYGKNLRPDDLNLAQAYLDLAVAYKLGGRLQEAQEMDGKALRIQEQVFGTDSPVARETRARIKQNSNREQLQNPKTSGKPPVQHAKAN